MPTHVIGQCSDLHLDGSRACGERARQVLRHFNETAIDLAAVVITGDLTADGRPAEYAQLVDLLAELRHPVVTCPGNHDDRATYREVLLGEPRADTPVNEAHRLGELVILAGDSTLPGEHGGLLTDETLAWFDAELATTDRALPVVLAFHHPPVILHSPVLDGMRQQGAARLEALLDRHPHAVAVLAGHAHTAAATTFAGRPLRVAPGVISTLTLPWETGDLLDLGQPPGLAFHVLDTPDDGTGAAAAPAEWRLVTHYRTLTSPTAPP